MDPSTKDSSLKGDALIGNYVRELGLPWAAVAFIMNAGPKSMAWLTEASASAYRIHYEELRRDEAERYRDALTGRHVDPPVPVPAPVTSN
jgi:hypothetical protein